MSTQERRFRSNRPTRIGRGVTVVKKSLYTDNIVVVLNLTEGDVASVESTAKTCGNVTDLSTRTVKRRDGEGFLIQVTYDSADEATKCIDTLKEQTIGDVVPRAVTKRAGFEFVRRTAVAGDPDSVTDADIFVGGIDPDTSDDDVKALFEGIAEYKRLRRAALITLSSADAGKAAVEAGTMNIGETTVTIRAQRPERKFEEVIVKRRFVGNKLIVYRVRDVDDSTLRAAFQDFGKVKGFKKSKTGGTAIVTFETNKAASEAVRNLRGKTLVQDGAPMRFSKFADYLTEEELTAKKEKEETEKTAKKERASAKKDKSKKKEKEERPPVDVSKVVFVKGTEDTTDEELKGFFSAPIAKFSKKRGYALVTFETEEDAKAALAQNGTKLSDDATLRVEAAKPRRQRSTGKKSKGRGRARDEDVEYEASKDRVFFTGFSREVKREEILETFGAKAVHFLRYPFGRAILEFDSEEGAQAAVNRNGEVIFGELAASLKFARVRVKKTSPPPAAAEDAQEEDAAGDA